MLYKMTTQATSLFLGNVTYIEVLAKNIVSGRENRFLSSSSQNPHLP